MPNYRNVRAFELAQTLSEDVHLLAAKLPARKAPGLAAQLCRSVESVPANMAEGAGRDSQAQYVQSLIVARGSAQEASVHLRLASRVDVAQSREFAICQERADLVASMLSKLIDTIRRDLAELENQQRTAAEQRTSAVKARQRYK